MIATVFSFSLNGLEGVPVTVEADVNKGLPSYELVGLPDAAVTESKEDQGDQNGCQSSPNSQTDPQFSVSAPAFGALDLFVHGVLPITAGRDRCRLRAVC